MTALSDVSSDTNEQAADAAVEARLRALPRGYRWRLLALVTLIYATHSMDRSVTSVVLEPIKVEFGLSDGQVGALGGLTHGLAFCLFVLPLGWLADRINRRNLLALLVACWSGMALLGGFAANYATLLAIRFGVGAAEAGGSPVSMSLIGDVFSARRRPTAIGFLYLGLALGQGFIFLAGGLIALQYGWRPVYIVAGIPGLILAILLLLLARETPRGGGADSAARSAGPLKMSAVLAHMARSPALLLVTAGITGCAIGSNITWVWMTSVLVRAHRLDLGTVGTVLAVAGGVFSGLGSLAAGPATSWLAQGGTHRLGYAAGAVALLATPLGFAAILSESAPMAITAIMGLGFMLGAWLPPSFGLALALAPATVRASVVSVIQLSTNFFALALAPVLVGVLSDVIGGEDSLVQAMAIVFAVMLLAAAAFGFAGGYARREIAAADGAA